MTSLHFWAINVMRKNLITYGTAMFLLALLFLSCRKTDLRQSVKSDVNSNGAGDLLTLEAAKLFYDSIDVKAGNSSAMLKINSMSRAARRTPHFAEGIEVNGIIDSYVEVPLSYDIRNALMTYAGSRPISKLEKEKLLNASFDRLIVHKSKATRKIETMIVSYVPDRTALGKFSSEVKKNRLGRLDKNFTGWLIYQRLDGTKLFGIRVIYGQAVKRIKFHDVKTLRDVQAIQKKVNSGGYEVCETIEWIGYTVYCIELRPELVEVCEWVENGEYWVEETCVYVPGDTECFTGDCEEDTNEHEVDNGENGSSDINTALDNPCLNNVWKKLRGNLNAEFTHMLTGTFGVNDHINFTIKDGTVRNGANAESKPTAAPHTGANGITYFDITVTLNDKTLPSASQEYVATAILHEVMHSYMEAKGVYFNDQFLQHREMFYEYLENMRDALQRFSGEISDQEAIVLALDGMKDFIRSDPELYDLVMQYYHIDTFTAVTTPGYFKDRTRGTSTGCN
jgi:hypothetical protein